MSEGLNAVNFGQTTLSANSAAGAVSLTFAAPSAMPSVPFIFQIDSEIMEATALAGSVYTVTPGLEGSTQAAHAAGAQINVVLTADMYMAAAPNGSEVVQTGAGLQMGRYDANYDVTASAAGIINLPANPVPMKDYWINDYAGTFGANNQTVNPLGIVLGLNGQNFASFAFHWAPTAATWRVKL